MAGASIWGLSFLLAAGCTPTPTLATRPLHRVAYVLAARLKEVTEGEREREQPSNMEPRLCDFARLSEWHHVIGGEGTDTECEWAREDMGLLQSQDGGAQLRIQPVGTQKNIRHL